MKILVVGGGGREHALAWKLGHSEQVTEVRTAGPDEARDSDAELIVIGPEAPLVAGLADELRASGRLVFGPSKAAAEIEGSKVFCRDLARRLGVPVAGGESFDDPAQAADFAKTIAPPIVVKADGLAAGKGVLICRDHAESAASVDSIMRDRAFGDAGGRVIVEEFLEGRETSIFCITDGESKLLLEPAQDYKRALDGDEGLNTGGMGSYSPVPWLDESMRRRAANEIVFPLIDGLAEMGRPYSGCFYAGLMITDKGPYLIEVNCRFGDPETQVLLPRLRSDLAEVVESCARGRLTPTDLEWSGDACVCVVVASGGYPESYETGKPIGGIEEAEELDGVVVFHAGTERREGEWVSAGGRVLNVSALGASIPEARAQAYRAVGMIKLEDVHYRRDIAEGVS